MEIRQSPQPLRQAPEARLIPRAPDTTFGLPAAGSSATAPATVVRESPREQAADNETDYGELLRQSRLQRSAAQAGAGLAPPGGQVSVPRALAAYGETIRMAANDVRSGELVGIDQYA